MSLITQIKSDQLIARKGKMLSVSRLLTTLIGEAEKIGKDAGNRKSTDAEVISVIKKFIKNNNEIKSFINSDSEDFSIADNEIMLLSQYLPKQLTEDELREVVQFRIRTLDDISIKMMGMVMSWLKKNYEGEYDGKVASKVVKELLKK